MVSLFRKKQFNAAIAVLAVLLLYLKRNTIADILFVLLSACLFLIMLSPLCTKLENKGISSSMAAFLSLMCVLLAVSLLFSLFIPYLVIHTRNLFQRIVPVADSLAKQTALFFDQTNLYQLQTQSFQKLITSILPDFSAFAAREGIAVAAQAGKILFSLVLSYYLLRERLTIGRIFLLFFPLSIRLSLLQAAQGCKNALLAYLCGTLKTSLFVSCLMYLGLCILNIENALLLAFFMGIFEVFPYIGPFLGAIPILLSVLPLGIQRTVLAILLILLVQQIENSFAGPYFTASSTSIHPLFALTGVFVMGSLFGLWGILLAIPVLVSCRSLIWSLQKYVNASSQ